MTIWHSRPAKICHCHPTGAPAPLSKQEVKPVVQQELTSEPAKEGPNSKPKQPKKQVDHLSLLMTETSSS